MKRITILIHPDVLKKCRNIQGDEITRQQRSVSLSETINQIISDAYGLNIEYKETK